MKELKRTKTNPTLPSFATPFRHMPLMDEAGEHGDAGETAAPPAADMLGQIRDMVTDAVQPLRDQVTELEGQLAEARQQRSRNASDLFGGGAPAVRQGESALCENRGYSYGRLIQAVTTRNFDNAKLEHEIHQRLYDTYGGTGGDGPKILAPLGTEHMHHVDDSLRREIGEAVRQGVSNMDRDQVRWMMQRGRVNQDLSLWDETAGGALLGPVQEGELIDLLRAKEILSRLGATQFTFPANGRIAWPRVTGDVTGYWVGEGQAITESQIATGMLQMVAKKLGAICDVPNDLLRFQTTSSEALIRNSIAKTFARKIDVSGLTAVGSELEPKGLLNYSGINSYTASTTDTDGDTFQPQDVYQMVATVAEQDVDVEAFKFLMRPMQWALIKTRRADAVSAGDGAGPFVFQTEAANDSRLSGRLGGYGVIDSTNVRNTREKGSSGATLTEIVGGNWAELLIGRVGVIEFDMDPYAGVSGANFKQDVTSIRAIQYVDVKPRRPEAFIHCDKLLNS